MRIAYPTVTHQGFGNNLITVAKAYLIAQSCDMKYLPPVWPPNAIPPLNGYDYYFPATKLQRFETDLFSYLFRAHRKLGVKIPFPTLFLDRALYEKSGIADAGEACLGYLNSLGLDDPTRSLVVTTAGMWGGYIAIKRARSWLRNLIQSHSETRRRFDELNSMANGRVKVAIDIKFGSYESRTNGFEEGERNIRLPLDWYTRLCQKIRENSDCAFFLSTDAKREELQPLLNEIQPINYLGQGATDLIGLMIMIDSDLVICSNSTYSRLGCFLNDKPYIWIADTLLRKESKLYGYLWREGASPMPHWFKPPVKSTMERSHDAIRRCFPISYSFSDVPDGLKRYLNSNATLPIEVGDDLLYGDQVYLM
jgi:hypothetical protein